MDRGAKVEFFLGLGSRYSYLAATQIAALERDTGCRVRWRPLASGRLLAARGRDPFQGEPVSGQYDWSYRRLDAQRWAAYYGVSFVEPPPFATDPDRPAIACHAVAPFDAVDRLARRLLDALFVEGRAMTAELCRACAEELGIAGADYDAALAGPPAQEAHAATLAEALARGAFGVPTFFVGDAMFWGNDRLPLVRDLLMRRTGNAPAPAMR